jgi:hypothetical protein
VVGATPHADATAAAYTIADTAHLRRAGLVTTGPSGREAAPVVRSPSRGATDRPSCPIYPMVAGGPKPTSVPAADHDAAAGTFGSLGSPSTRSPMMLRWISAVPPQMVSDLEKKNEACRSLTG